MGGTVSYRRTIWPEELESKGPGGMSVEKAGKAAGQPSQLVSMRDLGTADIGTYQEPRQKPNFRGTTNWWRNEGQNERVSWGQPCGAGGDLEKSFSSQQF